MGKEIVIDFLKKHVIGKGLSTDEVLYSLEDGKLEGVYSDEMYFSNLLLTENGLQFDMTTIAHENIYYIDAGRKRGALKKEFSGISVFHYELAERKSTSKVTGIMRLMSSTVPEHTMEGIVYGVYGFRFEDNELSWNEQQLLYRDMPAGQDNYRAVAFDSKIKMYVENEKLRFEYIPTYYDFDSVNLTKQLSKDQYPTFLTKER